MQPRKVGDVMWFRDPDSALRNQIRHWRRTHFFRLKLAVTARKRRWMKHTKVIAITGSSTKTTTTALLRHILAQEHKVVSNTFNNAIDTVARTLRNAPFGTEFAVLEAAAGMKPQLAKMAEIIRPDIAIVTMIDLEHYSTYRNKEAVAFEKGHLVAALPANGLAFLNADDEFAMAIGARTHARVVSFGLREDAAYRASDISFDARDGLRMRVRGGGHDVELVANLLGRHFYLPVLAAAACALELGVSADTVRRAVASFRGFIDRCGLLPIPEGPIFVLDTNKAPYHSITLPMDAIGEIAAPRRTIVIGQIADYGGSARRPYTAAAAHAARVADRVFTVGPNAERARFPADATGCEFARFKDVMELAQHLKATTIPGEVVLLKSSRNIHLERAAIAFLDDVACRPEACGVDDNCFDCGLYRVPFHQHPRGRNARKALARASGAIDWSRA